MRIPRSLAVVVAAATGLTLAACTGAPAGGGGSGDDASGAIAGTITFQTWSLKNDTFTPYFNDLVKTFEKAHPKVTVKWVDQPSTGYQDKVLQQAESGQLPDVVNLPPDFAYSLAKAHQLVNLKKAAPDVHSDYVPGGLAAYSYDGLAGDYGFPWYLGTELNYWNTDLLKQGGVDTPPSSFDELLADAKTLATSPAKIPLISTVPDAEYLARVSSNKPPQETMFSNGKFHFDSPAAEKTIDKYAELYKLGALVPGALTASANADTNTNNFYKGTVAWTVAGPGFIGNNLKQNAPKLLPGVTATPDFGQPPLFVQGISVAKNSKHQAAALAFAKFATNNDNQIAFVKLAQGFYPGTTKGNNDPSAFAAASDVKKQNDATKLAADELAKAQVPNPPQFTSAMDTYSFQQIALAIEGKTTAKKALQALTDYCNQNLNS